MNEKFTGIFPYYKCLGLGSVFDDFLLAADFESGADMFF